MIFHDGNWQFFGVTVALFALLLSAMIFFKQQNKKTLDYEISEILPLFSVHRSISRDFKIFLGDHQVDSAYMSLVKFSNSQKTAIERNDFRENLSVQLTRNGQVLICDIIDKTPTTLNIPYQITEKAINFDGFALNKGENFTVRSFIINGSVDVIPTARIIDGKFRSLKDVENTTLKAFFNSITKQSTVSIVSLTTATASFSIAAVIIAQFFLTISY